MDTVQEFSSGDLYVRYAVNEAPDDKDFSMHVHERCEIFYFVSGERGDRYPKFHFTLVAQLFDSFRSFPKDSLNFRSNKWHYPR